VKPVLLLAPGRVVVGWRPAKGEKPTAGKLMYVSVDHVSDPFEKALDAGKATYNSERDAGHFDRFLGGPPVTQIVDFDAAAKAGIVPDQS